MPDALLLSLILPAALPLALNRARLGFRRYQPQDLTILALTPLVPLIGLAVAEVMA